MAKTQSRAPNISLNLNPDKKWSDNELWWGAVAGVLIQFAVLVIAGLMSYYGPLETRIKNTEEPIYSFPILCAGTFTLPLGCFLCTVVIETSSKETVFVRTLDGVERDSTDDSQGDVRIVWLQANDKVKDQAFESYAIIAEGQRNGVMTSRRRGGRVFRYYRDIDPMAPRIRLHGWDNLQEEFWRNVFHVFPENNPEMHALSGTLIGLACEKQFDDKELFSWPVKVRWYGDEQSVTLSVTKDGGR